MPDFSELKIDGRIATASDPDWDESRQAWNLTADQQPPAVALVEGADDIPAVVRFAGDNGLRVTGQGTGRVVGEAKGPKINGFTYKRRTNQRRRYGHRQRYTVVEITKIAK